EIISHPIDEQVIAIDAPHFDDLLPLRVMQFTKWIGFHGVSEAGTQFQRRPSIIRREKNPMLHSADGEILEDTKDQDFEGLAYLFQIVIDLRFDVQVRHSCKPFLYPSPTFWRFHFGR